MEKLAQNRSFKFMGGIEDGKQNIQFFRPEGPSFSWWLPGIHVQCHAAGRCRKTGGIYGGLQKEKRLIGDPQILCKNVMLNNE